MEGESNALILHLKHAYPWLRRSASAILAVVLAVHLVRVLNGNVVCFVGNVKSLSCPVDQEMAIVYPMVPWTILAGQTL
jgi:hypothetical protein